MLRVIVVCAKLSKRLNSIVHSMFAYISITVIRGDHIAFVCVCMCFVMCCVAALPFLGFILIMTFPPGPMVFDSLI